LGDTVNTASRLASAAEPGEILLTESVRERIAMDPVEFDTRTLSLTLNLILGASGFV
jgi:class 3 adenylate cyclase